MKFTIILSLAAVMVAFTACPSDQQPIVNTAAMPASVANSSGGKVVADLSADAQQALSDYATAKSGNANLVWSLGQMFEAYSNASVTEADLKTLVAQWTASSSTPISSKIASIFGQTSGTPQEKMQTLANAAFAAAGASTTSP